MGFQNFASSMPPLSWTIKYFKPFHFSFFEILKTSGHHHLNISFFCFQLSQKEKKVLTISFHIYSCWAIFKNKNFSFSSWSISDSCAIVSELCETGTVSKKSILNRNWENVQPDLTFKHKSIGQAGGWGLFTVQKLKITVCLMSKINFLAAKRQDMVPIIKMHTIVHMMMMDFIMLMLLKLMMLNAMLWWS